uniref:Wu:fj29h11 n=1 Tax=Neogobius melanostomus TaxID=47308 RepID=A0A8C6V2P3_9GOBI
IYIYCFKQKKNLLGKWPVKSGIVVCNNHKNFQIVYLCFGAVSLTMEKDLEDLEDLVRQYPEGIPLGKLKTLFQQTYNRNLCPSALGYNSMANLVDNMAELISIPGSKTFLTKEKDLEDLVEMVRKCPEGIPLEKLLMFFQRTYRRNLSAAGLGFDSKENLVASLDELFTRGTKVYHRSTAISDESGNTAQTSKEKEKMLENLINMLKARPKGVRLTTLASVYYQTYSTKMSLTTHGFTTVETMVRSLKEHFFIKGKKVLHVMHKKPQGSLNSPENSEPEDSDSSSQPLRGLPTTALSYLGPPLVSTAPTFSTPILPQCACGRLPQPAEGGAWDNMRAMEALKADTGGGVGRSWSRSLDPENINDLMQDVIRDIASQGELVTKEKVISRGCQLLQIPSLESARVKHWQIPALKDLQYVIREVNMFLQYAYSICTLYELSQSLAALKDKKRFEELNLGPLCKLPLVHRLFKVHADTKDDDIPHIETVDVLRQLRNFRRKSPGVKTDLADFMKHLSDHYKCESPYELGIRIHSVALPIATLSKVSRGEQALQEKAREQIQKELEEETLERLRRVKKSVLEALPHAAAFSSFTPNAELRSQYVSLTAAEVVLAVFSNAEGVFSPRMTEHVQAFLQQVSADRLARALFQLSICGGSLAAPQDLVLKDKSSKAKEQAKAEEKPSAPLPTEAAVKQFVRDSLSSQTSLITLSHVAALEKKLTKHFHLNNFLSLEMGSFLDFLTKHIQLLQECLGSALVLSSSSSLGLGGSGFKPTRQDVFEFIKQCGDLSLIDLALRAHYRLRDCQRPGLRFSAQTGHSGASAEAALRRRTQPRPLRGGAAEGESVGRLGAMNKDQALSSLLSCPLLEDMGQWSQWDLVFKPLFGSLKDFMERNAGTTGLSAVEVTPGVLLRTTSHTGDQAFCAAAESLDPVGTAGHLVSMVLAYGLTNAPLALLANHMQSSLAAAVARQGTLSPRAHEDEACYRTVADFLLGCLVRIPVRTCLALMQQVFLEPFAKVLGQTRSKEVLMKVAQSNPQHMNCLHRLGILLGITDWIKDYHRKLRPPQEPQENHVSRASAAQAKVTEEEEEEEDDEELYELASDPSSEAPEPSSDSKEEEEKEEEKEEEEAPVTEDRSKSEFGVGVELEAEGQKLMQVHQDRLGRSLDRLSTELYSKDTHFVLELIQNADDNSYASEDSITPALAFVVERDCITVLNNEMGFQEKNIRAICDVGRSTKGKHTYGYIGQKGIGFKSVFKVTDCPEIHSNGFHLRFDKNCGPMGYILPHWAPEQRAVDPQLQGLSQHSWTTQISLPLRSESHQTRNLFHDVHPSLLLFLHRLRSIAIYNQLENRFVTMSRKDLSHNILEVEHTDGTERWLVIKSMLKPPKIKNGVECTELALAFQLGIEDTGSDVMAQPQKQPVFAYLPLRTFGFRFIIQGDFDIPSSREDVDRDSSWNQWLRSEIPLLFLQAMEVFNNHPDFQGLGGLCHFLQFTPLPDEILDFFKPVALQIIQLLKGRACLPTLDGAVVYKLPSQVAVCQDPVIREVIGGEELEKHLCLSYLHPALRPAPPPSLLRELGVRYLRGPDVTTVTSAMARELIKMEGIHSGPLRKLAKLLVCNFRALEHGYGEADSILQTLRDLPIIPLSDGRVVALSGEGVFFPMEEASSPLSALYQDVCVVHQQVRELLRRLGVHELEPQEILQQHIYPAIHSGRWKSKPEAVVVSYLVLIKQHSSSSSLLELSDTAVPVLTSRGLLCPKQSRVYFTEEYGNISLTSRLPGYDWVLLSPCYVKADTDVAGWRELFTKLGVRDGFIIRKERKTLTASSPWSVESSRWTQSHSEDCVIDDYPCEEFYSLATAQLSAPSSSRAEFTSTVEHIHTVYSYLNKNCSQSVLKELFQHTPAVFVLQQRHGEEWVTGRFYHLKEVCWSDPTSMFLRYKSLTQSSSSPVQNPRVLAPFYTSLEGMKDFFTRLLNVDRSPNIKQYVGLLEVVCSSSPPSSDLLQDVSVLYATLGNSNSNSKQLCVWESLINRLFTRCVGMVSDLRVFPTKDNTWVSLSRKPMICDSRELEKVFRPHKEVCLLNLPPAEKKRVLKKDRSQSVDRPAFEEEERDLFLEICGVKRLSACVQSEAQTEDLRPCVSMQEMVRSVVPYIQRFLYHREDMSELYFELEESDIAERVKKLSFRQVGKLYRRYQLDVPERDSIIEMEDVICLLKDQKELYIQKDHLGAKLDICRYCLPTAHSSAFTQRLTRGLSEAQVVLSDQRDLSEIGEWGERLVYSFLLHWRDGSAPGRPSVVEWCNERGESGQPYDFKLTFSPDDSTIYVEVKSTVKAEKAFIHMSANELDFALKKKEYYHIFRVYSAGDAQNVRLCRIQNLAQHLHTKNLDLYIFV